MKILKKIQQLVSIIYTEIETDKLQNYIRNRKADRRIYFFCTPSHSNLGDQAQFYCWLKLFKTIYCDYEVICVPTKYRSEQTLRSIKEFLKEDDKLFIHSGYLLYDPHPELPFILDIIRAFTDRDITILPQTVNFIDPWITNIVQTQFGLHPKLHLMCRDEISLINAKKLFPNVDSLLMPDVVTSLIGDKDYYVAAKRDGILFCLRNDGEKYYSDEALSGLISRFKSVKTDRFDTTINEPMWSWDKHRENLIKEVIAKFSKYRVIVTDRYHGTIFSQIANTPVVVLSSNDHKLSSGVKWFPKDIFEGKVYYAKSLDEAYTYIECILSKESNSSPNPTWFKDNYYNSL